MGKRESTDARPGAERTGTREEPSCASTGAAGDEVERARDAALRLLTVRARSVGELRDRLIRKRFTSAACERVIDDLLAAGLLDDRSFARLWADERVRLRPVGRRRLTAELRSRRISPKLADEVADEVYAEHTERELAGRALDRRLRRLSGEPTPDDVRRLQAHLLRRGFSHEVVRLVLEDLASARDGRDAC